MAKATTTTPAKDTETTQELEGRSPDSSQSDQASTQPDANELSISLTSFGPTQKVRVKLNDDSTWQASGIPMKKGNDYEYITVTFKVFTPARFHNVTTMAERSEDLISPWAVACKVVCNEVVMWGDQEGLNLKLATENLNYHWGVWMCYQAILSFHKTPPIVIEL